ncbi:hypothetical protein [Moorena sp. SIO4G3]|uniref:hypothetical protein n=1 Tax=Moorena sp. SIO4G3 TaxID=2607821 RepID=UPI0025FCF4A6|nr:hypothetical protein [Moorena sp. SIO4G3]
MSKTSKKGAPSPTASKARNPHSPCFKLILPLTNQDRRISLKDELAIVCNVIESHYVKANLNYEPQG